MQWNSHGGSGLPVIAMSGDIDLDHEIQQSCEVMGISYVAKLLDLKELYDLVLKKLS